jgi:hypothetical protein
MKKDVFGLYSLSLVALLSLLTSCGELFDADEEKAGAVAATVTLDRTEIDLMVGDEFRIGVTLKPDTLKNNAVFWESADTKVITFKTDTLQAVGAGETTVTVSWPDQKVSAKATVNVLPVWQMTTTEYPYDMLIFASVTVNGRAADKDCIVAAFDSDENIRGVGQLRKDKDIDYMLLRIYSPDGESDNLLLRCYDRKRALVSETEVPITFSANSLGTLSELYKMAFK